MTSPTVTTALDGVVATTTSNEVYVGDYKRVAILFRRADNAGGTSTFTVKAGLAELASTDPTMTSYAMLIDNVANANTETDLTHTASHAIADANGDVFVWLDPKCPVTHVSVTVTETADGTHSAYIIGWED